MEKKLERKYTQLGIHIEGLELDPKKRKILEAGMASALQKILHEMDDIKRYGLVKVIPDLKVDIPIPFPHGIIADLRGRVFSQLNNSHNVI